MFISCPNCGTRYNLTPMQLGPNGKSVRCSNCGHRWHQVPVADPPPPAAAPPGMAHPHAAPPPQQPAYPGYPPPPGAYPGYPPPPPGAYPGYPPPGYPPPGYPPAPEQAAAPAPAPAPEPTPEPLPEPEPEPIEEEDPLPELEEDDVLADLDFDEEEEASTVEDEPLSQDELDAMFGNDDPEPVGSIVEDAPDDDDGIDADDLDDLDDPEPIPEVFTADETGDDYDDDEDDDEYEDEDEGSGKKKIIIAALAVLLLLGSGGGLFFFKDSIPGLSGLASMIGLEDDSLGAGLTIRDVKSTRESIGGNDVLVVRGVVANVSDSNRPVPQLELRLSDLDGNVVQTGMAAPLRPELPPGEDIGFRIQVESPSPLARRLEVTFIERPAEGGAAPAN